MTTKLEQELSKLKHGDHICFIYENPAEQMAVTVAFIMDGLNRGDRCLYIADDRIIDEVVQALEAAGVDIGQERQRGALRFVTNQDTFVRAGEFVPQAMIDLIRQAETEALTDGFSGLRLTGEPTWSLGLEPGCDRLIEYEALLNQLPRYSKSVILCQYHHSRFGVPCIHDVLRTHPVAILGDQVCPNPHYESPELVLRKDQPGMTPEFGAKRVDWWIAQLKWASKAEQERERVLEKLKQSERKLTEAQHVAHIGSWERDLRNDQVTWSNELYNIFGLKADEFDLSYQQFLNMLVPQDVDRIRALVEKAIRERGHFSCDYRITLADGSIRVLNDRGGTILNEEGVPIRLVGTAQDVTELRNAEQALQKYAALLQTLSHRLLEVQEEERRHLARELHDQVGQMLTGLGLLLKSNGDLAADAVKMRLASARAMIETLIETVRGLSSELRPAELDQLGLLPALISLFERFTGHARIRINFQHEGIERRFTREVETTAYRIIQESLTNAARHAGVAEATVRLWTTSDTLGLQIEDRGRGFDPEATLGAPRSIGLAGMRERVELLNGQLTIKSQPGAGTLIAAELPLHEPTPPHSFSKE